MASTRRATVENNMLAEISRLRQMSVSDLQAEWFKLYGAPTRSRNRTFLYRRLAWRLQELQQGGLSARAKDRLAELGDQEFIRSRPPVSTPTLARDAALPEGRPEPRPARDPRLPVPGSVISKAYKGTELRAIVRDDGIEFEDRMFNSLTAVAKHVTGSRSINGHLFWGLTQRKRRA